MSTLTRAMRGLVHAAAAAAMTFTAAGTASAADVQPREGDWIVHDFRFHDGTVLPDLRLHYTTLGAPDGEPVVVLHGTGQSAAVMLAPPFASVLFGPGQPLDLATHYVILPDALGHGRSSKPSDGMRTRFPHYDYDDMADAVYRLVAEHLGVRHVRLVIGNSMGGMETWLLAEQHPAWIDVAVPMASMPIAMSGRNWMMRRLIVDSIRQDPDWHGGDYTVQPKSAQFAFTFFNIAMSGGARALQKAAPTSAKADALVDQRLAAPAAVQDANDMLYQWDASRDFDPSASLERIRATLVAINSMDDERNPPELGLIDREIKRVPLGRVVWIPASDETSGHGTTFQAKYWKDELAAVLRTAPRVAPTEAAAPVR